VALASLVDAVIDGHGGGTMQRRGHDHLIHEPRIRRVPRRPATPSTPAPRREEPAPRVPAPRSPRDEDRATA